MSKNINYDIILAEYAAGTLDLAQTIIVAAHLGFSRHARQYVSECEQLAGLIIEQSCTPVSMNQNSLDQVLSRLDNYGHQPPAPPKNVQCDLPLPDHVDLPVCVTKHIQPSKKRTQKWMRIYPGIQILSLPLSCRRSRARLMNVKPGTYFPHHKHTGMELTLVLDGEFSDEHGTYVRGDLVVADVNDDPHHPQACKHKGCVAIHVLSGGLNFTRFPARLLNPFLRFF